MGWMPVVFGLYSHSSNAMSTPSLGEVPSNAGGSTVPSGV